MRILSQIHLRGYGAYEANTTNGIPLIANLTCKLDPIFTMNNLTFVGNLGNTTIVYPIPNTSSPAFPNSNTTLIRDITTAVTQSLLNGQSQNGNVFADFIQGLVDAYPGQVPVDSTLKAMFQSMFEIAGLSVNGYWSSKLFANGPPRGNFSRPVSGYVTYTVYGWNGDVKAIAGLIPFTIVVIIGLCLLVWSYDEGSCLHNNRSGKSFASPTKKSSNVSCLVTIEPLSIVAASGAGDFDWISDVNIEMDNIASSTGFVLKKVDGKWVLLSLDKQG